MMSVVTLAATDFAAAERRALLHANPATRKMFGHLTPQNLASIEAELGDGDPCARAAVVGAALLRRAVHGVLAKRDSRGSVAERDSVLGAHSLPEALRRRCAERYGTAPPATWLEAVTQLEAQTTDKQQLWSLLDGHPMLEYVPVQCQSCGHVVADESTPAASDADVGLKEVAPTADEAPFVRGGWFRGPRDAVVFELTCRNCAAVSRWYRATAASVILNPNRWGRLCGEQEDLRAWLAEAVGMPLRTIVPLDWDHVWSESRDETSWQPPSDDSARNFAARLDEGIGSWTCVLAIHHESAHCEDVTDRYLSCASSGGTADATFADRMARYRSTVGDARRDASGASTQARTIKGHVLERAGFGREQITAVLQRAAADHGAREWWDVGEEDVKS